jgi:YegS/Rv2252/BmrU family lipid kinase
MDGIDKAKKAVGDGCNIIVAAGGDGTVSEVVNGIYGSDATLGVLPVGTGNDFARTLRLPMDLKGALYCIFNCKSIPVDLGVVNGRCFINVASVGFDSQVVMEAGNIKKKFPGPIAYILGIFKALNLYKPFNLHIETEDGTIERQATLIAVANGVYYGGGMKIAPQARIDDGFMDVCLVSSLPKNKIFGLFPLLYSGRHLMRPEVEYFRVRKIMIKCDSGFINSDGEIIGTCPAEIQLKPKSLRVITPLE